MWTEVIGNSGADVEEDNDAMINCLSVNMAYEKTLSEMDRASKDPSCEELKEPSLRLTDLAELHRSNAMPAWRSSSKHWLQRARSRSMSDVLAGMHFSSLQAHSNSDLLKVRPLSNHTCIREGCHLLAIAQRRCHVAPQEPLSDASSPTNPSWWHTAIPSSPGQIQVSRAIAPRRRNPDARQCNSMGHARQRSM